MTQDREEPMPTGRRLKFRLAFAALLLAATAGLVVAAEWLASCVVALPSSQFLRNTRLNHTWPPNQSHLHDEWVASNPDFPTPYLHVYNAQGWLETYDVELEKPPDVYRIFYVGDSFTEGCVPMKESVPSRVEEHLNALPEFKAVRFEVINTGTSSYSPVLEYILIRHYLLEYAPDLIVINVDMTDDFDDWKYRQTLVVDDEGNPSACPPRALYESGYIDTRHGAVKAGRLERLRLFLRDRSYTYNLVQGYRAQARWNQATFFDDPLDSGAPAADGSLYPRWAWCRHQWDAQTEQNVQFTLDVLERIGTLCRQHNVKLMLTGVPHYPQFTIDADGQAWMSRRPHEEIRRVAEQVDAAYLDSIAAMAPHVEGTKQNELYYAGDMHFNPRGNALWAEAHIQALTDPSNGLLPTPDDS